MLKSDYFVRRRIINVAGSKEIMDHSTEKIELAKAIGERIIRERNWMLLTGGARGIRTVEEPTAIDYWVALGAQDEVERLGLEPEDHIITLHPKETDHPLHNIGLVEVTKRKTPALRRFDLVARADAIVTIEGLAGLVTILELSIALDKVLIPIPCTGGTSKETWDTYEDELVQRLGIRYSSSDYVLLRNGLGATEALADMVVRLVRKQLSPLCYVAIPPEAMEMIYQPAILPTLEKHGLRATTVDDVVTTSSTVVDSMVDAMRNARLVIADITNIGPDISYQLGIAEVLGKPIVPICMSSIDSTWLGRYPLDLRFRKILPYSLDRLDAFCKELERFVEQCLA